jgi:integrase
MHPPTASHVEAAFGALPNVYRLPLLVLDATGMRVGELESLRWGDVDEPERRWRVSKARTKTRQGRWVPVPEKPFQAVLDMVQREDRGLEAQVFAGFANTRFRTALARACKATGTPLFSPHDTRHRRATLWHLSGMPAAEALASSATPLRSTFGRTRTSCSTDRARLLGAHSQRVGNRQ